MLEIDGRIEISEQEFLKIVQNATCKKLQRAIKTFEQSGLPKKYLEILKQELKKR